MVWFLAWNGLARSLARALWAERYGAEHTDRERHTIHMQNCRTKPIESIGWRVSSFIRSLSLSFFRWHQHILHAVGCAVLLLFWFFGIVCTVLCCTHGPIIYNNDKFNWLAFRFVHTHVRLMIKFNLYIRVFGVLRCIRLLNCSEIY